MKKHIIAGLIMLSFVGLLAACSNEETLESRDTATNEMQVVEETETYSAENNEATLENEVPDESETSSQENAQPPEEDRKIIYNAHLHIEVKNLDQSILDVQQRTESIGGYIVESLVQGRNTEVERTGQVTLRVPQENVQEFIQFVEDGSSKVKESSISGQDVTEEYVDLQSRLKTKQMVEERLLAFMEQAEKTEDLLAISNDLATVQEEIEGIKGRIKYLENKTDLATVTIFLEENNVSLSGGNDQLNTWEKTKEQFVKSIQFLIAALSNIFIFLVGNLPVFVLIGVVGLIIYLFIRKRRKRLRQNVKDVPKDE